MQLDQFNCVDKTLTKDLKINICNQLYEKGLCLCLEWETRTTTKRR